MPPVELAPVGRTPLDLSLARLRTLVSPYTGLVSATADALRLPDDARLVRVACRLADPSELVGANPASNAGGANADPRRALAAAIAESAERYAGTFLPADAFVLATSDELGPAAVEPRSFALFSAEQYERDEFPFVPFDRSTRVRWVRGFGLPDGEERYLPVQLVYLSFEVDRGETRIGYTTSNGLACGATREEAILGGLLELVERDAFMIAWACRLSLPRLAWDNRSALQAFARRYLAPARVPFAAIDLSAFWDVPTALGVVRGMPGDPAALGIGASSAATIEEAVEGALAEAFSVRAWARSEALERPRPAYAGNYDDVTSFGDHVALHADPANAHESAFLDSSPSLRNTSDVPALPHENILETIEAIVARLAARSVDAYVVDVTSPDVRASGLFVTKVVAPELCALDAAHSARFLGGTRLYGAAAELGLVAGPLAADEINPFPHPFP